MKSNTLATSWVLALIFGLVSCGGDDESNAEVSANGIWQGSLTRGSGFTSRFAALIGDGKIIGIGGDNPATALLLAGNYSITGQQLDGNVTAVGQTALGQSVLGSAAVSGTVNDEATISASFSGSAGDGSFLLNYAPTSEKNSSLGLLSGIYVSGGGNPIIMLSIDPDGAFTGLDSQLGCVYNGAFSIIDPDENLYDFQANVSNCEDTVLDGDYTGFATVDPRNELFVVAYDPSATRIDAPSPVVGIIAVRQ